MNNYDFFKLLEREDSIEVSSFKSRYNQLVSYINTHGHNVTVSERNELSIQVKNLQDEIKKYVEKLK